MPNGNRARTCSVVMGFGKKTDYQANPPIDKPMYERLLDADLMIADLSTSNANALYELGVRHALRPHSTIVMADQNFAFPFDLNHLTILRLSLVAVNEARSIPATRSSRRAPDDRAQSQRGRIAILQLHNGRGGEKANRCRRAVRISSWRPRGPAAGSAACSHADCVKLQLHLLLMDPSDH
jgi:hypothetical protein